MLQISVVVTCHDLGRYLDEAVGSVLAQTRQALEIIIVDDCSTSVETLGILASYDRPRTRILRLPRNLGLPGARNHGARLTSGQLLCFLDADDVLDPQWLEKAWRVMESDPGVSFVSHWLRAFGDEAWDWAPEHCDLETLLDVNTVNGAALVRREAFEAVGGFDEQMREGCEDWEFWIRVVASGRRGTIVPEFLFRYRRRPDSMSRRMNEGTTHDGLYAGMVRKHAELYAAHLERLLLRREADAASLLRSALDLEEEHQAVLRPQVELKRAEAAALRQKVAALDHEIERAARLEELERERGAASRRISQLDEEARSAGTEAERLRRALEDSQVELERMGAELTGLGAALGSARGEVAALRSSLTWRATRPLRRAFELVALRGRR